MNTPPLLAGAALLFWGWQTGFHLTSALMALVLEGAGWTRLRWEFSDDDFRRLWTICTVLLLGAAVYAFTDNAGPAHFSSYFQNPNPATQSGASVATAKTASAVLRWLPMALFPFVAAQAYSSRRLIPLSAISLIARRRLKQAQTFGQAPPGNRDLNISFPYFALCLFAASVHAGENNRYFWGLCILLAWALWSRRTRRFGIAVWTSALVVTFVLGYYGQNGISQLQAYIQNLDPQWLLQWMHRRGTDPTQSKTSIGQLGRLKTSGRIVIRLEPKEGSAPPAYLHEASYRLFWRTTWSAGYSPEMYQGVTEVPQNSGIWPLLHAKTNADRVGIACYLDGESQENPGARAGLLPLPSGACRLENLYAISLRMNRLGAVLTEGPGLVTFDALYGPGATIDAPFNPAELVTNLPEHMFTGRNRNGNAGSTNEFFRPFNPDKQVPPRVKPALDQVISQFNLTNATPEQAMRVIHAYFENHFTYSTWQDRPRGTDRNESPLTRFLLTTHQGHCEYFATATVLLLRELGIPARYAIGYAVHEKSGKGYVVRLRDGHAWCQVWNDRTQTWQDFDTTPASWVEEDAKDASAFQSVSDLWSWLKFQISKFRWGQSHLRKYLLLTLTPVLALLLYQVFFRQKRRRLKEAGAGPEILWPGTDSEFYLVEQKLGERGLPRQPGEPLSGWLGRALADPALASASDPLRALLRLHYSYRFDPRGLSAAEREELKRRAELALAALPKN